MHLRSEIFRWRRSGAKAPFVSPGIRGAEAPRFHLYALGFLNLATLLAIVLNFGQAFAQVDVSAWPQVRVEVMALDDQGNPIAGMTADQLVLKEDNLVQTIADLKPTSEPQSVCILIDASGSMYDRIDTVRIKARRLLKRLPADDEVCLADFSKDVFLDQKFTQDRDALAAKIDNIRASGGTALRDALVAMADYMRTSAKNKSRAIILFSDVADNASSADLGLIRQKFERAGSPELHLMCLPAAFGNAAIKHEGTHQKAALALTKLAGGLTYFPRNAADIDQAVDNLAEVLGSRYMLTYQPVNTARDADERVLEVSFDKAHATRKAVIRAPEGYYAPAH